MDKLIVSPDPLIRRITKAEAAKIKEEEAAAAKKAPKAKAKEAAEETTT
jgi:hypothetical protein